MTDPNRGRDRAALCGVLLFAIAVRGLGFEQVFSADGVVFAPADATYHMRRAFYSFVNFPEPLLWDPYLNYPDGVAVPWPPLFDLLVGGVARLFAQTQSGFEKIAVWASTAFGALTVVPIFMMSRAVATSRVGLGAALIFAVLPISVRYGRVGNPDHHSAVVLVGMCLVLLCLQLVRPEVSARRIGWLVPWMVIARLAMLLTWHGSLLYLGLFEACVLLNAALTGRSGVAGAEAIGTFLTAMLLFPFVDVLLPLPIGGAYSSISLSRLHVLAMLGAAVVATSLWWSIRRSPTAGFARHALVIALSGTGFIALLLLLPETRGGLLPAAQFITASDGAAARTLEQQPLFARGEGPLMLGPEKAFAYFAYLIPLAPFAFQIFVRDPSRRPAALVLTLWTAVFAVLAVSQRRFGNDLAPLAAVAFALMLAETPRRTFERLGWDSAGARRLAAGVGVAIALGLLVPALLESHVPQLENGLERLRGEPERPRTGMTLIAHDAADFARKVRAATPETSGFLDQRLVPEYGILAEPNLGHILHYVARRATPTDPMGPYIGPANRERLRAFLATGDESRALALAAELNGRYVVAGGLSPRQSVVGRLHAEDGTGQGLGPRLEHFRLITESEPGHVGFASLDDGFATSAGESSPIAYKLFEIVPGARIEFHVSPGTRVIASLQIETPSGRRFPYFAMAVADEHGRASLRVPYSTEQHAPVHATGPMRVHIGDQVREVLVRDEDVTSGNRVEIREP